MDSLPLILTVDPPLVLDQRYWILSKSLDSSVLELNQYHQSAISAVEFQQLFSEQCSQILKQTPGMIPEGN